ncbi:MAG: DUF1614 domain-containing protein [candidate division WOR-3 bacterium]
MIFVPIGLLIFLILILFSGILFTFWILGGIPFAFTKLGISPQTAIFLFTTTLIGSLINLPLTKKREVYIRRFYWFTLPDVRETIIAINLGGAIIPLIVSIYILLKCNDPLRCLIPTLILAFISKSLTKVVPGKGFVMPALVPPLIATLLGYIFYPENPAACAYVSGTLGVLIGADLLNLHRVKELHSTFVSIGGAGVFDGIFLTGIISALLT